MRDSSLTRSERLQLPVGSPAHPPPWQTYKPVWPRARQLNDFSLGAAEARAVVGRGPGASMKRKQELRAYRLAELMESRTARPGELWAILTGQLDRHAGLDRITPRTKIACKDCGVDLAGAERVSYDTVRCAPCARTLNRERVRRHRNTGKEPSR